MKIEHWKIDKNSKIPIYLQVAEMIKGSIMGGELLAGTKLSQRTIATQFGTGRRPVMEAFEILEASGFITSKPQSGTTVTNNIWLKLNDIQSSHWLLYRNSGRHKSSPDKIYKAFTKMDDEVSTKINGDRIAGTFKPQQLIVAAMPNVMKRLNSTDDLGIFSLCGLPTLKIALAEHMKKSGIDTSPGNIILTSGIGESLAMICYGFLGTGINLFHETPSFVNTIMLMQSTGANMNGIPMDDEGIDFDKLLIKLRRNKNAVLYIQPVNHNPTGIHMSKNRRDKILGACAELGVPIIENDMFRDYSFGKPFPRPLKAFDQNDQVIYIGSLLSSFMGFKISWIVAPKFILERLRDIKTHYELVSNVVVEMIAEEMLSSGAYYEYFKEIHPAMLRQYEKIMDMLDKHLSEFAVWRKNNPSYFIWLEFKQNIDIPRIYETSEEHLFFPGEIFDWDDKTHARLNTLGADAEQIENWIKKIASLIKNN